MRRFVALSGGLSEAKVADEARMLKMPPMSYAIYILRCSDGTYYTGLTKDLEARLHEHRIGARFDSYTYGRRPVELVWSEVVESYQDAFQWEHRIKGWSRAKKEALIRGDIEGIHQLVKAERRRREKIKDISRAERRLKQSESRRRSTNDKET